MNTSTTTTLRRRITAATTLALGAGAIAVGTFAMAPAAQAASPMTFEQACGITHGRIAKIPAAGIEQCFWQDPSTGNEWHRDSPLPKPYDPNNPPPLGPTGAPPSAPSGTQFGQACLVTQGWNAVIPAAGIEECHWQDPDGNEHIISNPLPTKKVPVGQVTPLPVRK